MSDNEKVPPFANEPDDGTSAFEFQFGAYGETKVRVYADHLEDALEVAVEWLDDNAPGHLVKVGSEEIAESAKELGIVLEVDDYESEAFQKALAHAEMDLTHAGGHTTMKHGEYLRSWEWHVNEIDKP